MTLELARQAFFTTGASAEFDTLGLWARVSPLTYGPFSTGLQMAYQASEALEVLSDLPLSQDGTSIGGDAALAIEEATETATGLFDQAIAFGTETIGYDFYSLL